MSIPSRSPLSQLLIAAIDQISAPLLLIDREQRIAWLNTAYAEATGYGPEELINQTPCVLKPGLLVASDDTELWDTLLAGQTWNGTFMVLRKDGKQVTTRATIAPVRTQGGEISHFIAVHEAADHRHSESAMQALLKMLPIGVVSPDALVLEANPALERILGLSAEQLAAGEAAHRRYVQRDGTPITPDQMPSAVAMREQRPVLNTELGIVIPDRPVTWVAVSATPLPGSGAAIAVSEITERRNVEERLKASEEQYRLLFTEAPHPAWVADMQFRFLEVNHAATEHYGYTREEFLSLGLLDLVPPEDAEATRRAVQRVLQGRPRAGRWRHLTKSGQVRDVEVSSQPLTFAGQPAWISVIHDVTERNRAAALQHALYRISEEASAADDLPTFYASLHFIVGELIDARNFYIAIYDEVTGRLEFPYFVDQFDTQPQPRQLTDGGLTEYVLRTGRPLSCAPGAFDTMVARGEVKQMGAPAADYLGVPLIAGGRTVGVLAVQSYRDDVRFSRADKEVLTFVSRHIATALERRSALAERQRTDAALRRLAAIVESAEQAIVSVTLEGSIVSWNPAAERLYGYSAAEILGRSLTVLAPLEGAAAAQTLLAGLKRGESFEHYETERLRKDGSRIWVTLTVSPLRDADGSLVGGSAIESDVTQRRQLEEQLRQAQRMEVVGQLAGGVAHDFNNLLGVIMGYAETARAQLGIAHPISGHLDEIIRAAERTCTLTRQLLTFSRRNLTQPRHLDLNTVLGDTAKMVSRIVGEHVTMIVRPAADLGTVFADPGQIELIIINIALNARDAMPKGGRLIFETANVDLDGTEAPSSPGRYVMLAVSDTGVGMDEETQSHLFEPFFTTKPTGQGTGLGLATVYGIVKQGGGYINVASAKGSGATFKIYLPRVDAPTAGEGATVSPESLRGHETILVVEDSEPLQKLIQTTLRQSGRRVLIAADGEEALALARATDEPIDLLLTDVVMPRLGGADLAKQIVALRPGIRILYMSGYASDAVSDHGLLGEDALLLEKPFTLDKLVRTVREALDRPPARLPEPG
jgi:two-component system cell cycle sensor histidine kinase/response regulator CckA